MADKKKQGPLKKQVKAQTKVKLSQASKRRKRGLKGTKQGGKFQEGGIAPKHLSHVFQRSVTGLSGGKHIDVPGEQRRQGDQGPFKGNSPKETYRVHFESNFNRLYRDQQGGLSKPQAEDEAHRHAYQLTQMLHNGSPDIAEMRDEIHGRINVRQQTANEYRDDIDKRKAWKQQRGAALAGSPRPEGPIKVKPGAQTPTQVVSRLTSSHKEWLEGEMREKDDSPFYKAEGKAGDPGAKKRLRQYTDLLQQGYSSDEAYFFVKNLEERRGRPRATSERDRRFQSIAEERIDQRLNKRSTGKVDKYKPSAPSHQEFGFGIRVPGVDTKEKIKSDNPDWSDADVIRERQAQRGAVDDWLVRNQRSAHEARQAAMSGKTGASVEPSDRVVFFTTNLGSPAPSVPANSLIGQYIIKKRKKMVVDSKGAQRWQVKGQFPAAVRDRHLIEVSTGLSMGAQGRYGVYRDIGVRRGTKASKGFGKQIPVGTKVLRDANNMPVYDDKGNIRYTEGYTRPFSLGTRDTGLRIYLG